MKIVESLWQQKLLSLTLARFTLGINILKICLPVHSGLGLSTAGTGSLTISPFAVHVGIHISSCIADSLSMNVSR
jgi:hypothetical protein